MVEILSSGLKDSNIQILVEQYHAGWYSRNEKIIESLLLISMKRCQITSLHLNENNYENKISNEK